MCRPMRIVLALMAVATMTAPFATLAVTVVDVAAQSGLPSPIPSNGDSVVFDYNGDGLPDILLSAHGQEWPLLRQGPPGRFTQVLPGTFATGQDRHGCTSGDFNNDGLPDIYCVRGACKGICRHPYPDELYLERPDRTFAKIAGAMGASDEHGRGRDAKPLDFNHDGLTDLLVANETSTAFPQEGNHLFRNEGSRFVDVLGSPLRHTIGTFRVTVVPKPDGYPDAAMRTSIGVLYYPNDRGTFRPGRKLGGASSWDVDAADLNGDGLSDLVIVRQGALEVRLNDGSFTFGRISYKTSLTQGRDVALCQLDGRSGVDIYVVQGVRPANQDIILLNNGTGMSFERVATPHVAKGHGDVGTCVPRFAGALGAAVLVTNTKWISAGDPDLGPTRLVILRP